MILRIGSKKLRLSKGGSPKSDADLLPLPRKTSERAKYLARIQKTGEYRNYGYASFGEYAREKEGISENTALLYARVWRKCLALGVSAEDLDRMGIDKADRMLRRHYRKVNDC